MEILGGKLIKVLEVDLLEALDGASFFRLIYLRPCLAMASLSKSLRMSFSKSWRRSCDEEVL